MENRVIDIIQRFIWSFGLLQELQDFPSQFQSALAAFCPAVVQSHIDTIILAETGEQCNFSICIRQEAVDANYDGNIIFAHIFDMFLQIGKAFFQCFQIFRLEIFLVYSPMHLKCPDGGNNDDGIWLDTGKTAFDIHELFRAQIGTESGFRYRDFSHFESQLGSDYGIASMGNIGKGTAVNQGRCIFRRLDNIGFDGIFHENSHSPFYTELTGPDRIAIKVIGNDDISHPFLQIHEITGQAENSHDFRSYGNHEMVFPWESIDLAAETYDDITQCPVIHIHDAFPYDAAHVDAKGISLMYMIVDGSSQQVVGCRNSMHIARKVKIDIFHGENLGIAAASSSPFDTKYRSQRRFAQCRHRLMPQLVQSLGQADCRKRLAFSGRGRGNSRYQHEFPVFIFGQPFNRIKRNFCFIFAI